MLTPLTEHTLLLFWLQLLLLLAVARGLGALATRVRQPAVVGELGAGLLVGPTLLGRILPDQAAWLFPGTEIDSAPILTVAWIGIVLLLVVTGFETDLGLLRRLARQSAAVSLGSLVVPLAFGFGLGWVIPAAFHGEQGSQLGFALFLAVALSVSALPVVAKILADMRLLRRNVGQIVLAAGMANDLVGWILLGVVAGVVSHGGVDLVSLGTTVALVLAFVVASLTVGQRATDSVLRTARASGGYSGVLTVTILIALAMGAVTQVIGVEAVLGAFVAGIVLGRSRYQRMDVRETIESMTNAIFAPVFFATAGLYVDLGAVLTAEALPWAIAVIAVAAISKLVGSAAGAGLSGLSRMEGLAAGVGLNARGALEIVVATIGLRLGVLNPTSYTAVVVMAIATSLLAPPLLRVVLRRIVAAPEEAERMEREEFLGRSVIARVDNALVPTRGGLNSLMAAHVLDLALRDEARVTVLTIDQKGRAPVDPQIGRSVLPVLRNREADLRTTEAEDIGAAVLREADLGYGMVAVGLTEPYTGADTLSPALSGLLSRTTIPLLLVRRGGGDWDAEALVEHRFRHLIVPITGTTAGHAAEELGYALAARCGAEVDAVHVVLQDEDNPGAVPKAQPAIRSQAARTREVARRFGQHTSVLVRVGQTAYGELVATADERGADLIVLGTQLRAHGDAPFLGHGVEYILSRASQTVAVIVFPATRTVDATEDRPAS